MESASEGGEKQQDSNSNPDAVLQSANPSHSAASHQPDPPAPRAEQTEHTERKAHYWLGHSLLEWLTLSFDALIAITATVGLYLVYQQLGAMRVQSAAMLQQLEDAESERRQGSDDMQRLLEANEKAANSSEVHARSGADLAAANKAMADAAKLSAENSKRIARANELSVQAAARSLEETQRSVAVTQDIARAEQRAWLGVSSIKGKPVIGEVMRVTVTIVNSGRAPARNVLSSQLITFVAPDAEIRFRPDSSEPVGAVTRRPAVMPGETFTLQYGVTDDVMTAELIRDFVVDQKMVLFARLSYDDNFEQSRVLPVCFAYTEWKGPGSRYYDPETVPDFEPCTEHQGSNR